MLARAEENTSQEHHNQKELAHLATSFDLTLWPSERLSCVCPASADTVYSDSINSLSAPVGSFPVSNRVRKRVGFRGEVGGSFPLKLIEPRSLLP